LVDWADCGMPGEGLDTVGGVLGLLDGLPLLFPKKLLFGSGGETILSGDLRFGIAGTFVSIDKGGVLSFLDLLIEREKAAEKLLERGRLGRSVCVGGALPISTGVAKGVVNVRCGTDAAGNREGSFTAKSIEKTGERGERIDGVSIAEVLGSPRPIPTPTPSICRGKDGTVPIRPGPPTIKVIGTGPLAALRSASIRPTSVSPRGRFPSTVFASTACCVATTLLGEEGEEGDHPCEPGVSAGDSPGE
jgi:hypothetical protein